MHITILGLGLIGGSLGMALKKNGIKYKITGYARRPITGFQAVKIGAVDVFEGDPKHAVREAEAVILATPILAMKDLFAVISGSLKKGCVVSDVGSTKKQIMSWAKSSLPEGTEFIGGHPMAGKEKAGIQYADADLFKGCTYCLVAGKGATELSLGTMQELARSIGARPVLINAEEHDRFVAAISHVPFIISSALFAAAQSHEDWDKFKALASSGFRDITRLASGDPSMYHDICYTNEENIKFWLNAFRNSLKNLESRFAHSEDLKRDFYRIKKARDEWIEQK